MRTFAGTDKKLAVIEVANILLQSIPYNGTSTWGKGADNGFEAFMEALENMELYDIETQSEVYKKGVHILEPFSSFKTPEEMFLSVYNHTKKLLETNKFLTTYNPIHYIVTVIKHHSYPIYA